MKKYNVIEYKSPEDALTIDDFYKTVGYACLYKGYGERVDAVPINELTVSIFRATRPEKMFLTLQKYGHKIEEKYPGICQTMRKRRYRRISEERGRNEYTA